MHESPTDSSSAAPPVFGFILFGGPLSGAMVRDIRLANELAERGYRVHVWWAMEWTKSASIHPRIHQHWLFHGLRYRWGRARGLAERLGRLTNLVFPDPRRFRWVQKHEQTVARVMAGAFREVIDGVEHDDKCIARFEQQLRRAKVTHLLPMLAALAPWAIEAAKSITPPPLTLITFQGYELYVNYARRCGLESALYARFQQLVEASPWPAITVSEDYADRVHDEIGIARERLRAIPPGVPLVEPIDRHNAEITLARHWPNRFRTGVPLITYLGRRDSEKGIDLLLYAAAILRRKGYDFQLVIAGPTLFGRPYRQAMRAINDNLRGEVIWQNLVSDEIRSALFAASRMVVYPSIHREPFGMVPVEAAAYGTPSVVPDYGGVASAIEANGRTCGLRFNVWDSGDLARQLERLLTDDALHADLSGNARAVAEHYSVANLADRVLAHMDIH